MTITSSRRSPAQSALDSERTPRTPERCPLSERQLEIVGLAAEGLTSDQIGARLGSKGDTVKSHLRVVFRRLDAKDRCQAVAICVRAGWV